MVLFNGMTIAEQVGVILDKMAQGKSLDSALYSTDNVYGDEGESYFVALVQTLNDIIFGIVGCALLCLFFYRFARSGRPFSIGQTRLLKGLALVILLASVMPDLANAVLAHHWHSLPNPTEPLGYGGSTKWFESLINATLLYGFTRVFEYGCILQTEDDGLL